jgi:hypothetical protein
MKIDYNHLIAFILIFMIFQYILMISELYYYLNMISDIQAYKINLFKNEKNEFIFKNIVIYTFLYVLFAMYLYYCIVLQKKTLFEGYLLIVILTSMWDVGLFSLFDKAVNHSYVLLYDTFIVGGVGMLISQYIIYNYYDILKNYTPLLFIIYLITMFLFFYKWYKYNPDLSNIKGVVLF